MSNEVRERKILRQEEFLFFSSQIRNEASILTRELYHNFPSNFFTNESEFKGSDICSHTHKRRTYDEIR